MALKRSFSPKAMSRLVKGQGIEVECTRCSYVEWQYEKDRVEAAASLRENGWCYGLRGRWESYGWTCPTCSRELAETDVEVADEVMEVADGN
jgi:hypothetical protein